MLSNTKSCFLKNCDFTSVLFRITLQKTQQKKLNLCTLSGLNIAYSWILCMGVSHHGCGKEKPSSHRRRSLPKRLYNHIGKSIAKVSVTYTKALATWYCIFNPSPTTWYPRPTTHDQDIPVFPHFSNRKATAHVFDLGLSTV